MRESTRGLYLDEYILRDPAFLACLNDCEGSIEAYKIFSEWIDGKTTRKIAEEYGTSRSNVQGHLNRTKAIYDIFAGREITGWWERYGLRRIVATRIELWRSDPKMNGKQMALATKVFNDYYDGCKQAPKLLLALSTDEGIEDIPRSGEFCQKLYLKARERTAKELINENLEKMQDLIDLRNLIMLSRIEGDHTPVDRAMARLMDCGIYSEDDFYRDGWKPIYRYRTSDIPWGIDPRVIRRAYQKALKRRHPDIKDPIIVLITELRKDGVVLVRKVMYGISERDIQKIVKELSKKGWQTGLSGQLPGMPARMIQIRKEKK